MEDKELSHPLSDHRIPPPCPDPLCLRDMEAPPPCPPCPRNEPKPTRIGWGGKRPGAGAPAANLNRLVHGKASQLLKHAVDKLAADPELRAFLLLVARAATTGEIPETTKRLITEALASPRREAAAVTLRRLRDES